MLDTIPQNLGVHTIHKIHINKHHCSQTAVNNTDIRILHVHVYVYTTNATFSSFSYKAMYSQK